MEDKNLLFKNLKNDIEIINIDLNDSTFDKFYTYYKILTEWNGFMNLTAITDPVDVFKKHFTDSVYSVSCKGVDYTGDKSLIDVGTGAGFPGIPLKLIFPNLRVVLMDSLEKRVKFLNHIISELGLKNIEVIHSRAEDLAYKKEHRDSYDYCVSRAVANLSTLTEYCLPFVKKGGKFIAYKSEKAGVELDLATNAIKILKGRVAGCEEKLLPYSDINRTFIIIEKTAPTPGKYPRKSGTPSKNPL